MEEEVRQILIARGAAGAVLADPASGHPHPSHIPPGLVTFSCSKQVSGEAPRAYSRVPIAPSQSSGFFLNASRKGCVIFGSNSCAAITSCSVLFAASLQLLYREGCRISRL
jgi:hypothetical protein